MTKQSAPIPFVADVIELMERIAPSWLAEKWDNCGMQVGSLHWPAERVWIALDPLPTIVQKAAEHEIDLLITHHPLVFHPLKSIDVETPIGKTIEIAMVSRLSIFSAHTNLDSAKDGVNDVLARAIGLNDLSVLVPSDSQMISDEDDAPLGIGRVGWLKKKVPLEQLARQIKERLNLTSIRVAGDPGLMVDQVAVCSGSGSSLLDSFFDTQAQVYISGDLRYHDARNIEQLNRGLIDIGHFPSEHLIIDTLCEQLRVAAKAKKWQVSIEPCRLEQDPFLTY